MNTENNLGAQIRNLRKALGLTQEQLAEMSGIDNKHLSKIENGLHLPSYKTLASLSKVLNANLKVLDQSYTDKNINQEYLQSVEIINSAKNDAERKYYLEVLKLAQKGINLKK